MDEEEIPRWSWRRFEFAGVAAFAVTMVCLLIGESAEQYATQVVNSQTETAVAQPRFNAIDYAATASIKSGTVVIGPCDVHKP